LSADDRDNDRAVLLTYLAVELDRVERTEPEVFRSLASPRAGLADVARLASSIASMSTPVVVVLDQAEAITNPECRDVAHLLRGDLSQADALFARAVDDTTAAGGGRRRPGPPGDGPPPPAGLTQTPRSRTMDLTALVPDPTLRDDSGVDR
jgi:hypothetical protein